MPFQKHPAGSFNYHFLMLTRPLLSSRDQNLMPTAPKGWSQPFSVLPDEPFNITSAIKGSVASWQAGDFNYDAASQYQDAFSSGQPLTSDLVKSLQALDIAPETAGFFNIPVCATYDLRFFPPAASSGGPGCKFSALGIV